MTALVLISLYSTAVVASSLFGGLLPSLVTLTHLRMQLILSFVGGLMLGVGLLHLLPHGAAELGSLDAALLWVVGGLLGMFFLIRTFHFHEHGVATPESEATTDAHEACSHPDHEHVAGNAHDHGHGQTDSHDAHAHHHHHHGPSQISPLGWVGVAFGLSLHTFLDGVALGAAVIAELHHGQSSTWAGLAIFLAILLHKPLDALSITTLMHARGWSRRAQQVVNAGFALMCPMGALAFALLLRQSGEDQHLVVGAALSISAGIFLCISLSDLLPEVQFHHHDRFTLSAALLLGVCCAYGIGFLEPAHVHEGLHQHGAPHAEHDHNHKH
jgi:zinc and cadmium transporter